MNVQPPMSDSISLQGMEFFAYHGYYPEERKIGNRYGVDLTVYTDFSEAATHDRLSQTVNYEELYQLVKTRMEQPAKLLEHLAQHLADAVLARYPGVRAVTVGVSKFNPPIGGVCRAAQITIHRQRTPSP